MTPVVSLIVGVVVVFAITVATGYFVAQEFAYVAVDRSRLASRAAAGDEKAERTLGITRRTSFMLSGAQLGITVTGLLVGYVAEPLIGQALGSLVSGGASTAIAVTIGGIVAEVIAFDGTRSTITVTNGSGHRPAALAPSRAASWRCTRARTDGFFARTSATYARSAWSSARAGTAMNNTRTARRVFRQCRTCMVGLDSFASRLSTDRRRRAHRRARDSPRAARVPRSKDANRAITPPASHAVPSPGARDVRLAEHAQNA